MDNFYARLLSPVSAVAEATEQYIIFTERHLQVIWLEQKYFKQLVNLAGESIEVISPGIWNHEAGPDFFKAHLRINGQEVRGDVELHLSEGDWFNHRHQCDPRYDNVVLHLALWQAKTPERILTSLGQPIVQAYLENFLTIPLTRIFQLIDLDLYPYRRFVGSGRCAKTVFRQLPQNQIVGIFRKAAHWRLSQKLRLLKTHIENPCDILGAGIAMALGYKKNSETFLKLYHWLKPHLALGEEALFVLNLGICGFFNPYYSNKWQGSERYRYYKTLYMFLALSLGDIPQFPLVLHNIRPLNHPIRRMACLAKVVTDPKIPLILPRLLQTWSERWEQTEKNNAWSELRELFIDLLPHYSDPYWTTHYTFEVEPQREPISFFGNQIKLEILINTVLPALEEQVRQGQSFAELEAFENFYGHFPAAQTGKTRYLTHRFFGDTPKGDLLSQADIEQGAYQLHRDFCLHYEASCEGCPFVDRYIQHS